MCTQLEMGQLLIQFISLFVTILRPELMLLFHLEVAELVGSKSNL